MGDSFVCVDTTLSLGQSNTTNDPSSSKFRNKKKQRKQLNPISSYTPPVINTHKAKLQPVCLVKIEKKTELYNMFVKANWEPMLYYPNKRVLPNTVTEFYKNMEVRRGAHDVIFITSVVNSKPLLLDHIDLGKALKLTLKLLNLANVDISKEFIFDKMEHKLYLSVLCGLQIPHTLFSTDIGICYEHFTQAFQTLALIIRGNIFPNISGDKLMTFAEVKLMYKLASHKVTFNLPYMILMHMINGFKKGYMLYGLMLTKVFEYFKLNISQQPHFQVASTIYDKTEKIVVPLPGFGLPPPVINLDPVEKIPSAPVANVVTVPKLDLDKEFLKLQASHDELTVFFNELKESFQILVEKHEATEAKVKILMEILGNTMSRAGRIEEGSSQMINVQLGLVDIPFLPLLEELVDNQPRMAHGNVGVVIENHVSDMETDTVNNQIQYGFEHID